MGLTMVVSPCMAGDIKIESGASLYISGTNTIPMSNVMFSSVIMWTANGSIDGDFTIPNSQTLGLTGYKSDDGRGYYFKLIRTATVTDVVAGGSANAINSNGARALAAIEAAGEPACRHLVGLRLPGQQFRQPGNLLWGRAAA